MEQIIIELQKIFNSYIKETGWCEIPDMKLTNIKKSEAWWKQITKDLSENELLKNFTLHYYDRDDIQKTFYVVSLLLKVDNNLFYIPLRFKFYTDNLYIMNYDIEPIDEEQLIIFAAKGLLDLNLKWNYRELFVTFQSKEEESNETANSI